TNLQGAPGVAGVPWQGLDGVRNLNGVITASGFAGDARADGFGALSFGVEVYPALKELLAVNPNFLRNLSELELADLQFDFYIFAAATPLTTEEFIAFQIGRAAELRERILEDAGAPQSLLLAAGDANAFENFYL